MPLPIEKVQRVQPEYQFMCKLGGIHIRASLICILPYRRPRANRQHFAVILKTLVDDSETSETLVDNSATSETLNPTEIFHRIYFV